MSAAFSMLNPKGANFTQLWNTWCVVDLPQRTLWWFCVWNYILGCCFFYIVPRRVMFDTKQMLHTINLSRDHEYCSQLYWIDTGITGCFASHYNDVIMSTMASQMTSDSIVYLSVCSGPDQRKHQSSASLVFVRGIHRWLVNSPHKWPVTQEMFPFDDVIMKIRFPLMTQQRMHSILKKCTHKIWNSDTLKT